ncbi:histidine tRNA synthetase [Metschnikowia bicuspidata var. bicuspidata NRRL YB-4993]|uniref:Histidine--tRNA ligase, mitochondrial n=1 Tax=Metschnikowia bicuspidata var. bicuspidata NRRL YB-4993 TaxID=869754 RepID=A0A1A0H558_9ASCO|nr:histidine tRNA synthetase [Metschnikowia bicuspidata var. bicuspidata NRRL YB-4993]OBA19214.1 histidine tRNA synthetase [Metschnikowia bicuspidata var. bicuspidata NRRL YB-4993]
MSTESPAVAKAAAAGASQKAAGNQKQLKKSKKNESQFLLKTPKGTKDWSDKDMVLREEVFGTLSSLFKRHGGVTIDTPVFELREILTGKYGEDSKLIYNLEDQGGELTSLRYDLTVPFARFVACNSISSIKRYHIAKVYRRDQPAMTKGRMREFYQCDFDIAGNYETMIPDSEILAITCEGLTSLGINDFKVKLNHRKILDGIFQACGVKEEDVRKISSAVDKLDKLPWEVVKKEMTVEKGQLEEVADRIGEFVKVSGSIRETLSYLQSAPLLAQNECAQQGIVEMAQLADYVEALGIENHLSFDLSLARGLDYYTGLIYEAVTSASAPPTNAEELKARSKKDSKEKEVEDASEYVGVGSIAAGGRYDNLVGMFSNGKSIPCVGISFGVERIFSIIKARAAKQWETLSPTHTDVYVMAFGGGEGWTGFLKERMAVTKQIWSAGINAEYLYKAKANPRKQFDAAEKAGAKLAVILGKEEYPAGKVRVKVLGQGDDTNEGELVDSESFLEYVKEKLAAYDEDGLGAVTKMVKNL